MTWVNGGSSSLLKLPGLIWVAQISPWSKLHFALLNGYRLVNDLHVSGDLPTDMIGRWALLMDWMKNVAASLERLTVTSL